MKRDYLLGIVIGKLRNRIFRLQRLRYLQFQDIRLTVEEFILLNMVSEKSNQISQNIAIATGKNKSVVMRMLDSLEKKFLIRRIVNPSDRRENLLETTEYGDEVVQEFYRIEKALTDDLLSGVSEQEFEVFNSVLDKINRNSVVLLEQQ